MTEENKFSKSRLVEALARIAGRPPATYSRDQLTHANNTIVEMQSIAVEALCSDDADSAKDEPINNLLEKSRAYWAAHQRYHAECQRQAVDVGIRHVPAEDWNPAVRAASNALSETTEALNALLERLFPQPDNKAVWEAYHARFYNYVATVQP